MENYHEACFNMDVGNEIMVESNTVQICQLVWFTRKPLRKLDVRCVARCWSCTRWSFTSVWKPRKSRRRNMQQASMHDGVMVCFFLLVCVCVFVFCCMCLATYLPLPPSLPTCLHACITCTHALHYAHIPIRTCIQIHAPDIQHIHRHTVHIYTYLHVHPYTSIYIHIHACVCIPIYIYTWIIKISDIFIQIHVRLSMAPESCSIIHQVSSVCMNASIRR